MQPPKIFEELKEIVGFRVASWNKVATPNFSIFLGFIISLYPQQA